MEHQEIDLILVLQERHWSVVLETSQEGFHPQKEPMLALEVQRCYF